MTKLISIMLGAGLAWSFSVRGQIVITKHEPGPNILNTSDFGQSSPLAVPDPVRLLNGHLVHVDGSWSAVSGQILQVIPKEGMRVEGYLNGQSQPLDFLIVHLPYKAAAGETFPPPGSVCLVQPAGSYTYTTVLGNQRTILKYDYGVPAKEPPLTPQQLAEIAARKKATAQNALEANEDAAAAGDAYGLLRMGERYRDGDGVETNLVKARVYFLRAADAGNQDATNELAKLPAATTSKPADGK